MKIEQRNIKQNHNTEAGVKVDKCVNLPPPEYYWCLIASGRGRIHIHW